MANILLVEDDETLVRLYKLALEQEQFTVEVALDGPSGLAKTLNNHPDLVLLDLTLPQMDGLQVMKQIREDAWGQTVPIIILTNSDTSDEILNAVIQEKPAYYFIKANTTPESIITKIKETLEKNQVAPEPIAV
jgi:two-component system, OmpR family, alkaline phosphatase synthesis response regulator PhoP